MLMDIAILVFMLILVIIYSAQLGRLRRELELLSKRQQQHNGEEKRLLRIYQSLEEAMESYERYVEETREELSQERECLMAAAKTHGERSGGFQHREPEIRPPQDKPNGKPQQILQLLSEGKSVEETARRLGLSKGEVGLIAGIKK